MSKKNQINLIIPQGFLRQFNVEKNTAEQRIVEVILKGAAILAGNPIDPDIFKSLTREIVRNDDARYFHIVETQEIEQIIGTRGYPKPAFVGEEDVTIAELGLADLVGRPEVGDIVVGQEACRKFLQTTVEKLWERIENKLLRFSRLSLVRVCFLAIDELARDEAHWNLTTRSLFALHENQSDATDVFRKRRSQWAAANIGNRLLIETGQYACPISGGMDFTMADHSDLLAEVTLLITFAHHRDAVAYGFLKAEIQIYPNGEIDVDHEFYNKTLSKYLSSRSDEVSKAAAERYSRYFETITSQEEVDEINNRLTKLGKVFEIEFGFGIPGLMKISEVWRMLAVKSESLCGEITEQVMMEILLQHCNFSLEEADAFLARLTLPIRNAWNLDFPPRCKREDVYPWRYRRQLSLLLRPLVESSKSPRKWIISTSFFEKSIKHIIRNIESADFPERFFSSDEMRLYIGRKVNQRGHDFAKKVFDLFIDNKLESRLEVEMNTLGAAKKLGLGDIDVLAWNSVTGIVYAVECKRLLPSLTVREVIQRLEDFRGDTKEKDSLGRHLRRVEWLNQNLKSLSDFTQIPTELIKIHPLLVTNDLVPMQFFEGMDFSPEQILPIEKLSKYLQGAFF
jgi:hypothetical protein